MLYNEPFLQFDDCVAVHVCVCVCARMCLRVCVCMLLIVIGVLSMLE